MLHKRNEAILNSMFSCSQAEAKWGERQRFEFLKSRKSHVEEIMDSVNDESVCQECFGTGEVSCDYVNSDGNIERGTDTRKCECQYKGRDDEYDNQE